jgi:hypothetical protein
MPRPHPFVAWRNLHPSVAWHDLQFPHTSGLVYFDDFLSVYVDNTQIAMWVYFGIRRTLPVDPL